MDYVGARGPRAHDEPAAKKAKKNTPCPELKDELKCVIAKTSMFYLLHHHLGLDYKYTKKRGVFMATIPRQTRIRKFMIEFSRALVLEATGEYVIVFTDESYIHQFHSRLKSWVKADGSGGGTGKSSSKGKRLVILHAITRFGFLATTAGGDPFTATSTGHPLDEPALKGTRDQQATAEWVWQAKSGIKDYHDNMDGAGFEWWLANRLFPAFTTMFPGKKMILVMDNASYHHQMNTEYYPEKMTPTTATKGLNAHVLRRAGCTKISVPRTDATGNPIFVEFEVPVAEPTDYKTHREEGGKAPAAGPEGTVYQRGPHGPSKDELANATTAWLKANKPEVMYSKVEAEFDRRGFLIVWTPLLPQVSAD